MSSLDYQSATGVGSACEQRQWIAKETRAP